MASTKVELDMMQISKMIDNNRNVYEAAKARIIEARDALAGVPAKFKPTLDEINSYTGTDTFEDLMISKKARLTAEFTALKNEMSALIDAEEF